MPSSRAAQVKRSGRLGLRCGDDDVRVAGQYLRHRFDGPPRGGEFFPVPLRCLRWLGFDSRGGIARPAVMPLACRKMFR